MCKKSLCMYNNSIIQAIFACQFLKHLKSTQWGTCQHTAGIPEVPSEHSKAFQVIEKKKLSSTDLIYIATVSRFIFSARIEFPKFSCLISFFPLWDRKLPVVFRCTESIWPNKLWNRIGTNGLHGSLVSSPLFFDKHEMYRNMTAIPTMVLDVQEPVLSILNATLEKD